MRDVRRVVRSEVHRFDQAGSHFPKVFVGERTAFPLKVVRLAGGRVARLTVEDVGKTCGPAEWRDFAEAVIGIAVAVRRKETFPGVTEIGFDGMRRHVCADFRNRGLTEGRGRCPRVEIVRKPRDRVGAVTGEHDCATRFQR